MAIGSQGENLVFLISQPRSGSTLLQRMLATNDAIHTASEPWLMLHPLYALRESGHSAEYNEVHAHNALKTMFANTPDGEQAYFDGLGMMYSHVYNHILGDGGATHFLDKTPRYYLVIEEIARVFPAARFIFLHRNPLAVLCSLISSWAPDGRLYHLERWRADLHRAPKAMIDGADAVGARGLSVRYEQVLAQPEENLKAICEHIDIAYDESMVNYGRHDLPEWNFGDKKSVYAGQCPDARNADRWADALCDPQMWRLCDEYLRELGPVLISQLGYNFDTLSDTLAERRPAGGQGLWTQSLNWLERPATGRAAFIKHGWRRFCHLARTQGVIEALLQAVKYAAGKRAEATGEEAGEDAKTQAKSHTPT